MAINSYEKDGQAVIELFGVIGDEWGGIGLEDFNKALGETDGDSIRLLINSEGGSVLEGRAMQSLLEGDEREVTSEILGVAASMAAQIALGTDRVEMWKGSYLMVHNPWGMAVGDHTEMARMSSLLKVMRDDLAQVTAGKAGVKEEEAIAWMEAETWFKASEAEEAGLADAVLSNKDAKMAAYVLAPFKNCPDQVKRFSGPPTNEKLSEAVDQRLRNLKAWTVLDRLQQVGAG